VDRGISLARGWCHRWFVTVGYGSIAVAGPWKGKPTIYEVHVAPPYRGHVFDLFSALVAASGAGAIEVQSNDPLLTVMLHTFARPVETESILFDDRRTTLHSPAGAKFRAATPDDAARMLEYELDSEAKWIVEADGHVAGAGDILFHYNRPYGDIYMKIAEPFRRRGLGSYLVQELKRIAYEQGNVPAARCNPTNVASRKTLQKAGFVPCGNILAGPIAA
jgi:GNAT superfamily N-acetyltransferase